MGSKPDNCRTNNKKSYFKKSKNIIMKKLILLLPLLIMFGSMFGCGKKDSGDSGKNDSKDKSTTTDDKKTDKPQNGNDTKPDTKLNGSYTGGFDAVKYNSEKDYVYSNRITVFIDSVSGGNLYGRSVVAGNDRPFTGSCSGSKGEFKVEAKEPGDDKYDGKFSFSIYPDSGIIKGKWTANDSKLDVTEREYRLEKKEFKYDANASLPQEIRWSALYEKYPKFPDKVESVTADVSKINASSKLLTKADIQNLYKGDLEIIRNAVYARHGYSFKSKRMRFIFDMYVDWYMPVATDVRDKLTDTEKQNIELIKRFEEHADKYYDEFGR
jgi:hypothetical protein